MALLFPPLGAGQGGDAAFDGAGKGEGGAAHLVEAPARMNADVDVHAAGAAGLGPAAQADLVEQRLDFQATVRTSPQPTPGPGSRSTRSSSG